MESAVKWGKFRALAGIQRIITDAAEPASVAGNGHALDPQRRRVGAEAEDKVVRRHEAREHFRKMSGNRHFADRISALAVLDPESGRAAAIISSHEVDAHPDHVGDVEAVFDVGDQLIGSLAARNQVQVACPRRRCRGDAALGVTGGFQVELTRGRAIENPGFENAILDQVTRAAGDAFGVERP